MANCQIAKCKRPAVTRGYCKRHYQQAKRHKDLSPLGYDLEGDFRLINHELEVFPPGYADANRPKWHRRVKF